jgi:long-subunit fatty acid transport protein
MNQHFTLLFRVSLVLLLFAGGVRATNGGKLISHGARSAGRGGTDTAVADTAISISSNPAGMLQIQGFRADFVLSPFWGRTTFVNAYNNRTTPSFFFFVPSAGFVVDPFSPSREVGISSPEEGIPHSPEEGIVPSADEDIVPSSDAMAYPVGGSRFRLGLAFFIPVGAAGEARIKTPTYPEGYIEETEISVLTVAPAAAVQLTPRLSLGFSLHFQLIQLEMDGVMGSTSHPIAGEVRAHTVTPPEPLGLTWNELFETFGAINSSSSALIDIDDTGGFGLGGMIGLQYQLSETLTLGLSYSFRPYVSDMTGKASVDASRSISTVDEEGLEQAISFFLDGLLPQGFAGGFHGGYRFRLRRFKLPRILTLGMAYRPTPRLLIAADFKWIDWSNAFKNFKYKLTAGNNANLSEILGSDTITGQYNLRWRDQYVIALGASYAVVEQVVIRAGYNFGNNPIPRRSMGPSGAGFLQHHGCFGLSYHWQRWSIDFAYVYAFRGIKKMGRSTLNPDLDHSRIKADQYSWYIGLSYQY